MLTFREEVGASAVLTDVEVLPQLAAGLEAQHGVVMQAVVPEQNAAPWLQHLGRHTLWVTSSQVSRRRTRQLQVPGRLTLLMFCKTSFILSGWTADSTKMRVTTSTPPSGTLSLRSSEVKSHWKPQQRSGT